MGDIADWMAQQAMTDAEPWLAEEWEAEDAALEQGPPDEIENCNGVGEYEESV